MQETAPSSSGDLQAGQTVGGAGGAAGFGGGGGGAAGRGGGAAAPAAALGPPAAAPAPTGWGAAAGRGEPTWNTCLQVGQRTCLPAASSGTCIAVPQLAFGQRMI